MAFHPIKPEGSTTGRGPSRTLWNASRYGEICMDPNAGFIFLPFDDFASYGQNNYASTVVNGTVDLVQKDAGTDAAQGGYGVIQGITVGADSDSCTIRQAGTDETMDGAEPALTCPLRLEAGTRTVFEARIQLATLSSSGEFAIGIGEGTAVATATGIASTVDFVGFTNYGGSTPALSATNLYTGSALGAAGTADVGTTAQAVTALTWHKVGFIVEGTSKIRFFFDGAEIPGDESTTLPDGNESLGAFISVLSGGAASAWLMDWWYGVQSFRKN